VGEILVNVVIYRKPDCEKCDEVIETLNKIGSELEFKQQIIDVSETEALKNKYYKDVPIVKVGIYTISDDFSSERLKMVIGASIDRDNQLEKSGDKLYQDRKMRGATVTKTDKVTHWLSDAYIWLIALFLFLYTGLPFAAPMFLKAGLEGPANVIYTIYKPLCHQLAFRSFFLYGEQPYYPRELSGVVGITYEELTGEDEIDIRAAQKFLGNEVVGYKVALCERDVAIYASMLLFVFVFIISKRKIKSLPWYIWVIIGIIPIGLDGTSQLPGLIKTLPSWIIMRESTPLLRTITGSLFGFTTAWYLFPLIEESMRETKTILEEKLKINQQHDQTIE